MDRPLQRAEIESDETAGKLILSLRDGQVWASWNDERDAVWLGPHDAVVTEMRLFMLQSDVAERLVRAARGDSES